MGTKYSSLEAVRGLLAERGSHSHTSDRYQADVLENVINCLGAGDCVIELGIFKGGLSCQLAYVLESTGRELILIDVGQQYIEGTRKLIEDLGLQTNIRYFTGTMQQFMAQHADVRPAIIIVDANHAYASVSDDIRTIKRMKYQPAAVVFHDASLRYARSQKAVSVRVDQAVADHYLRYGYEYLEIGVSGADDDKGLQRIMGVSAEWGDHHYHDRRCSEGILVVVDKPAFTRALPFAQHELRGWPQGWIRRMWERYWKR